MARRTTINPRRLVHSLGDASPLPRPGLKVILFFLFLSSEHKGKSVSIFSDKKSRGRDGRTRQFNE